MNTNSDSDLLEEGHAVLVVFHLTEEIIVAECDVGLLEDRVHLGGSGETACC